MRSGRPISLPNVNTRVKGCRRPVFRRFCDTIRWHLEEWNGDEWEVIDNGSVLARRDGREILGQLRKIEREWNRGYQTRIDEALPSERGTKSPRTKRNGSTNNRTTDTPKPSSTTLHRTSTGVRRQTHSNGELPRKLRGRK